MQPYMDDFMAMKHGFWACVRLPLRLESDFVRSGLKINVPEFHMIPAQKRRQLGFDVKFAASKFQVMSDRWEALNMSVESILSARHGRVLACRLASLIWTVQSMHLSWGPETQLYARHLYALIDSAVSLNGWVVLTEEVVNELTLWLELPRLRLEGTIWPPHGGGHHPDGVERHRFGWGGHTMQGVMEYAQEYFSEEECVKSSTCRELLGVLRCLQSMVHRCSGKFVVF